MTTPTTKEAMQAAPVAWRVMRDGAWVYFENHPDWHHASGFEVQPLYAYPMSNKMEESREALLDEDEQWAVDRGADLLEHYAEFIQRVKPDEIEEHPYLPELQQIAADLHALSNRVNRRSPPKGEEAAGGMLHLDPAPTEQSFDGITGRPHGVKTCGEGQP